MHVLFILLAVGLLSGATAKFTQTPNLDLSFQFDWTTAGAGTTTVAQCESLNLTWSRGTIATGPNPVAPYTLSIFTSTFVFPLVVDVGSGQSFSWPVPFVPGTQFQLCMFDANGNTGGCQRQLTVYPSLNQNPTCTNVTYPHSQLEVVGQVSNGPISQYGWPDQCTDIQLTPKNGTPPYMMMVAPTLHPPYNITVDSMSSVNWTIALSWASPFWVSLVDSKGLGWSNGPMHSGGLGTSACLTAKADQKGVSPHVTVGAGVGGTLLGLLAGLMGAFCLNRRFARRAKSSFTQEPIGGFEATGSHIWGSDGSPDPGAGDSPARDSRQIYVVHHDGGSAPVTVYTADGTEVVELPPSYDGQGRPLPRATSGKGAAASAPALQPQGPAPGGIRKVSL